METEKHGGKTVLGFRLEDEKKDYIENIIDNLMKQNNLDKGDALFHIITYYSETTKKQNNVSYSIVKPYNCDFLNLSKDIWFCFKPISSSKQPLKLGIDTSDVKSKCQACFDGQQLKENESTRKLLERNNIINLIKFYKEFLKLNEEGFEADCIMCRGNLLKENTIIMSRNGETLNCPKQNMDEVNIKDTCKEIINIAKKSKGCEYIFSVSHHVPFKGSEAEQKIKDILPKLTKLKDEKDD